MSGIGKVKNTESPHAMKEAAEASKKTAQKAAEAAKKAEEGKTVEKNDDVQISDKATKLSKPDNAEKTAEVKNADTKIDETSKQVTASEKTEKTEKSEKSEKSDKHSEKSMKAKIEEISSFVKELRTSGISSKEISKILKDANRKNNESIGKEIKQAYKDYKDKKISGDDFKNKLYGSTIKKVDGITSALQEQHSKVTFSANKSGSSSPSFANKENGATAQTSILAKNGEPALAEKAAIKNKGKSKAANQAAKTEDKIVMDTKPAITAKTEITVKATPPGLAKKKEISPGQVAKGEKAKNNAKAGSNVSNKLAKEFKNMLNDLFKAEKDALTFAKNEEGPGNADKVLGEIVGMFHEMDKMVNGLEKNLDEDGENKAFGDFAAGLKNMFSEIGSTESSSFLKNLNKVAKENSASDAHKVGMAQIKADTLSNILKGGHANSSFKINRVGDNGDGSGNFSAAKFMSEVSSIVGSGLDSYKDAKEAMEVAGENRVKQANAGTTLSSLV